MPQNQFLSPAGVSYKHLANSQTLLVKGFPGCLFTVVCNAGSSGATLSLYDSASTGTLSPTIALASIGGSGTTVPTKFDYSITGAALTFANGLVAVSAGTADWTIIFH